MNSLIELLGGAGGVILMALIQIVVVLAGFVGIKLLKKLSKKVELEIDDTCWASIERIVNTIVVSTNQRIVDEMKEHNFDGKLTKEQQDEVFQLVKDAVMACLSMTDIELIQNRYGGLDEGLMHMIESAVGDNHMTTIPSSTEFENEDNDAEEKVEETVTTDTTEEPVVDAVENPTSNENEGKTIIFNFSDGSVSNDDSKLDE